MKTPAAAGAATVQHFPTKNLGDAAPAVKPTDKASEVKTDGVLKDKTSKE